MSDIHIDDFYKDVARILVALYNQFPRKATLYVEDICGPDTPDEFGLHSNRHQACLSAMIWLSDSGYLKYQDTIRQEALDQVWLTHKAFTLLTGRATILEQHAVIPEQHNSSNGSAIPDSVRAITQSNIHQLREALKSKDSFTIHQVVQHLLLQSGQYQ